MYRVARGGAAMAVAMMALASASARAQQGAPPTPAPSPSPSPSSALDPGSPLAPLPDIGVDWPDLATAPGAEQAAQGERAEIAADIHYSYTVKGLEDARNDLLRQRFDDLSTLKAHEHDPANAAQLDRRAREDADLLTALLKAQGYYDARVDTDVSVAEGKALVTLTAAPGALYHFERVTLAGVDQAGAKSADVTRAFGVKPGDAVNSDAIAGGTAAVKTTIGEEGFPFAHVGDPQIVIDHATHSATLDMAVKPNGAKTFGKIIASTGKVFGAHHIQEIARFKPGDPYDATQLADLDRALIQTSLVSSVTAKPVPGATPDTVDIDVALQPAPPRTIAGELGYGTGEGVRAEIDWTHRNLFPPEGGLTLRGVLGTQEQLGSIIYRRNNFHQRDHILTAQVAAAHTKRTAYEAKTFSLSGSLEQQTNIFFQKTWTWSLGAELVASDERDVIASTGEPRRQTYFIGALPTALTYDGSDDLLNPTRGFRLGARVSPELSLEGKAFGYARVQLDASAYQPVKPGLVVAERVRFGSIPGAPRDAIAPSRRFYAGGGGSVRGYGYQEIGPRDPNNDPVGGRSLNEFSIEARVHAFGNFGVVPFFDAGNIYTSGLPKLTGLRYGTGIGVRYYSSFGPIRLDVGTPINPQKGDSRIAVYVSLGQAF
ncbi:autotransporter assembly complex protein TamA [Hephaestia mangrovi]|uniref:autotransporter assembly complex protein TamA n=1 Tax=Hephaestia mangrovi TaxID=2873268 RepID=UPI001CA6D4F2|nr:BamA/TamA family outer membrane protein [Hephaestia mangrovi]MBY8829145.1 BamA/TamA family outer membrane protein [Hephaestia mangrovi]